MPKAQGLEYEAQVPAFLQRMKQGHAALDGRHNVQIPRAHGTRGKQGRLNMAGEDGEDDPVMLDQDGNIVSMDEIEALKQDKSAKEATPSTEKVEVAPEGSVEDARIARPETENVSSGFGKKRKAVKVVGEDDNEAEEGATKEPVKSLEESTKDLQHVVTQKKENANKEGTKKAKKKKVKLSFDDPE